MRSNLLTLVIVASLFASCSRTIEQKIGRKVDECTNSNCYVDLKELTDFKWDRVYIFNYPTSLATINEIIGTDFENYSAFSRPMIFMSGRSVVYSENNQYSTDDLYIQGQLLFDLPDSQPWRAFTLKDAVFKASKVPIDESSYYFYLVQK